MESSTLAKLLIQDKPEAADGGLPEQVNRIREHFPLNEMVPMIRRVEGKPSERVRMKRLVKELQEEGFSISSYSVHMSKALWQIQEAYQQSGEARSLVVKHRDGNYLDPESLEQLAYLQGRMQEISLPMVAHNEGMCLKECDATALPWIEAGFAGSWRGFELEEALRWRESGITDFWSADDWRGAGYTPEEANIWLAAGVRRTGEAQGWISELDAIGITATPELVGQFVAEGLYSRQAVSALRIWQQFSGEAS